MMWQRGVWERLQGIYRSPPKSSTQRKSTRNHYCCVTWDSCFFYRRLLWKLAVKSQLSTTCGDYVNASLVVIYLGFAGNFARVESNRQWQAFPVADEVFFQIKSIAFLPDFERLYPSAVSFRTRFIPWCLTFAFWEVQSLWAVDFMHSTDFVTTDNRCVYSL